jgi:hypothetical protein
METVQIARRLVYKILCLLLICSDWQATPNGPPAKGEDTRDTQATPTRSLSTPVCSPPETQHRLSGGEGQFLNAEHAVIPEPIISVPRPLVSSSCQCPCLAPFFLVLFPSLQLVHSTLISHSNSSLHQDRSNASTSVFPFPTVARAMRLRVCTSQQTHNHDSALYP